MIQKNILKRTCTRTSPRWLWALASLISLEQGYRVMSLFLWCLWAVAPGWAGPPSPQMITEADAGRTIAVQRGEKFALKIRNPASGGYDIVTPIYDPGILKLASRKAIPPEPAPFPKLGDFGEIVFEFDTVGIGATDLAIQIARRGEVKKPSEEYLKVKVKVR